VLRRISYCRSRLVVRLSRFSILFDRESGRRKTARQLMAGYKKAVQESGGMEGHTEAPHLAD
jgi:hypothetical protein